MSLNPCRTLGMAVMLIAITATPSITQAQAPVQKSSSNVVAARGCRIGPSIPRHQAVDASGNLFVTGCVMPAPSGLPKALTYKINGSTGDRMWTAELQALDSASGYALAVDPQGDVIVAGGILDNYSQDANYLTVKYSGSTGQELWRAQFNGQDNQIDYARAVAVDANGDVYVTGHSETNQSDEQIRTVKYSGVDGSVLWSVA